MEASTGVMERHVNAGGNKSWPATSLTAFAKQWRSRHVTPDLRSTIGSLNPRIPAQRLHSHSGRMNAQGAELHQHPGTGQSVLGCYTASHSWNRGRGNTWVSPGVAAGVPSGAPSPWLGAARVRATEARRRRAARGRIGTKRCDLVSKMTGHGAYNSTWYESARYSGI